MVPMRERDVSVARGGVCARTPMGLSMSSGRQIGDYTVRPPVGSGRPVAQTGPAVDDMIAQVQRPLIRARPCRVDTVPRSQTKSHMVSKEAEHPLDYNALSTGVRRINQQSERAANGLGRALRADPLFSHGFDFGARAVRRDKPIP